MNRADIPAFPRPTSTGPNGHFLPQDGLTLREYLTGQAVIGVMALNAGGNPDYELVASHAVALADLTLIALDDVTHEDAVKRIENEPVAAALNYWSLRATSGRQAPQSVEQVKVDEDPSTRTDQASPAGESERKLTDAEIDEIDDKA